MTLKTHPTPKILSSAVMLVTDADAPFVYDLLAYSLSSLPKLGEAGLSGYTFSTTRLPNPIPSPGGPAEIAGILGIFIAQDPDDVGQLSEVFNSMNETIQERWAGAVQFHNMPTMYDSFLEWFSQYYDHGGAGNDTYLVSRLLDEEALRSEGLKDAVRAATGGSGGMSAFLVSGKGVRDVVPRGGGDAANPAWRRSLVHARKLKASHIYLLILTISSYERIFPTSQPDREEGGY